MSDEMPDQAGHRPATPDGEVPFARPVVMHSDPDAFKAPPSDRRVWPVFAICILSLVSSQLVGAVVLHWPQEGEAASREELDVAVSASSLMGSYLSRAVVMTAVVLLAAFMSPVPWRKRLRLGPLGISSRKLLAGGVGAVMLWILFAAVDVLGALPRSSSMEPFYEVIAGLRGGQLLAAVLVMGVLTAVSLELLFRGYIQTRLSQRWGIGWSILLTALLSGVSYGEISYGMFAFALAVYLGAITEQAGSIAPAMICHVGMNVFGLLLGTVGIAAPAVFWIYAALILAALILWLCLRYLRRPDVVLSPVARGSRGTR
jgi:uncharacterized protein